MQRLQAVVQCRRMTDRAHDFGAGVSDFRRLLQTTVLLFGEMLQCADALA
jgi:hypothetical protein